MKISFPLCLNNFCITQRNPKLQFDPLMKKGFFVLGGLSHLSFSGLMKMKMLLWISSMERWKGTRKME